MPGTLRATGFSQALWVEHETRFELAFPSPIFDGLILAARSSLALAAYRLLPPFRWQVIRKIPQASGFTGVLLTHGPVLPGSGVR